MTAYDSINPNYTKLFVCKHCNYEFFVDNTQYTITTNSDVMGWISEDYKCKCPKCQDVVTISLLF